MTTSVLPGRSPRTSALRARRGWAGGRGEAWRDWALLGVAAHAVLIALVVARPSWPWFLAAAVVLGQVWSTGTLTVLHDAGHQRFARRAWPNVLAVQTAVPLGLWVGHWARKHRVHHLLTQVYPLDEATRSSGLVRLHPQAAWRPVHRHQHRYAWFLYSLAWVGELRSQATYLRTGAVGGAAGGSVGTISRPRRTVSFLVEKALCLLVLTPYAIGLGVERLALLLVASMCLASLSAAVLTTVGHINVGVVPDRTVPSADRWMGHVVSTTASFSTDRPLARWLTGGLTHHLAHHLRPVASRAELPALHRTTARAAAIRSGEQLVEFPTLAVAVRGHWLRLRELGQQPWPAGDATHTASDSTAARGAARPSPG